MGYGWRLLLALRLVGLGQSPIWGGWGTPQNGWGEWGHPKTVGGSGGLVGGCWSPLGVQLGGAGHSLGCGWGVLVALRLICAG